jgi:hypothetical protein
MSLAKHFVSLGKEGIGNPSSTIAHSMAWFKDCVYVGVTNPGGAGPQDCPRILRYSPEMEKWDEVYRSPLVKADARVQARDVQLSAHSGRLGSTLGRKQQTFDQVPRDRGYRGMTVFKGKSDKEAALYVSTMSPWGSLFLRSEDGENFETISEPGFGNSSILSFRALTSYKGKLFTAPAGTATDELMDRNFSAEITVYVTNDPVSGKWRAAAQPGFSDPGNGVIFSLAVFNGFLYAGTGNHESGFQIWKTDTSGKPPYTWKPVITDGAYRYNLNMAAAAMTAFKGALYVGGGIPGFGYDKANDVGPGAAELIRIYPDDNWDLVVGTPRFTPHGLKVPLSAMGPGLDDPFNSVIWSMGVHENALYVGTHQWQPFDSIKPGRKGEIRGGYQLWATVDGEAWEPITLDAFGHPFATGARTLLSTPFGLILGTANHKPLLEKLARLYGRRIERPGAGGFEILLGN